ncbi:MAG: cyclic nucleotide-binding domain-containing protein [Actinobacteria bacterium]|nr:cyclic nucleotide-binding domain-containing protein [Actinomycetota bacterium]
MARMRDYLDHLAQVPLFSRCDKNELKAIARRATELRFEPGRQLVKEGRQGVEFFVIVSGKATVTRGGTEIASLGPGDFFGELALLDNEPRSASVTVDTPMEALVIDAREFRSLLEDAPQLTFKVLAGMARRIRDLDDRIH